MSIYSHVLGEHTHLSHQNNKIKYQYVYTMVVYTYNKNRDKRIVIRSHFMAIYGYSPLCPYFRRFSNVF